jgi:hypothetical protein
LTAGVGKLTSVDESGAAFESIAQTYLDMADVTAGTGFGKGAGLRRGGRIFAMLVRGSLVVKLSRALAAEVVATGRGVPFDPGHGRLMRAWVEVSVERVEEWPALVRQAFDYSAPR